MYDDYRPDPSVPYATGQVTLEVATLLRESLRIVSYGSPIGRILRSAVLADLVFMGRLSFDADGPRMPAGLSGFPPADLMLGWLSTHDYDGIYRWLRRGPGLRPVVGEWMTQSGRWAARSPISTAMGVYFRDLAPQRTAVLRAEFEAALDSGAGLTGPRAAAVVLSQLGGGLGRRRIRLPQDDVVQQCGTAGPVVAAAIDLALWASVLGSSANGGGS